MYKEYFVFHIKMNTIYILRLSDNKYYVGKTTDNIQKVYWDHLTYAKCKWTEKYKPLSILDSFQSNAIFIEDTVTIQYMNIYGIENVRGGSYCNFELENWQLDEINNKTKMLDDKINLNEIENNLIKTYINKFTNIEDLTKEIELLKFKINNFTKFNNLINTKKINDIDKYNNKNTIIDIRLNFREVLKNINKTFNYNYTFKDKEFTILVNKLTDIKNLLINKKEELFNKL